MRIYSSASPGWEVESKRFASGEHGECEHNGHVYGKSRFRVCSPFRESLWYVFEFDISEVFLTRDDAIYSARTVRDCRKWVDRKVKELDRKLLSGLSESSARWLKRTEGVACCGTLIFAGLHSTRTLRIPTSEEEISLLRTCGEGKWHQWCVYADYLDEHCSSDKGLWIEACEMTIPDYIRHMAKQCGYL
jgi:hypothetical protein